jgi:hypothetical protein
VVESGHYHLSVVTCLRLEVRRACLIHRNVVALVRAPLVSLLALQAALLLRLRLLVLPLLPDVRKVLLDLLYRLFQVELGIDTYDLVVTLEEFLSGLLQASESAIIVIRFATVLLLHRAVVLDVGTRVLLQVLLLLVSQMCRLGERYVLGDGGLA